MRYHIERRIGAGGTADVYEATLAGDDGFVRKVAIKRLALDRVDAAARASFLDEARIAGSLHHPGIVAIVDYGIVDGSPVQVLEWVDGFDAGRLDELADRAGPLPTAAACHIALEVARALDHAHLAAGADGAPLGIVHRDVKPSNVLVAWSGHVKLADFGIAKAHERSARTQTGIAKGTAAYMAPEQRRGGAVDARTDVFGLGCTLHALLVGDSPIDPGAPVMDHELGRAARIDPRVAPQLAEVVARAIAPRPADRWPTARAFEAALEDAARALALPDGRRALVAWLAAGRAPAGRGGLLDELGALGLHMVLAGDTAGSREFRMEQAPARVVGAPGPADVDAARVAPPPRPISRRAVGVVVAGAGVAGAVALSLGVRGAGGGGAPPSDARPRLAAPGPARPDASVPPVDAAPVPDAPRAPTAEPAPGARPSRPAARAHGFVAIGGEDVHLGTIFVDGRRVGTAPRLVELAVGKHALAVELRDGRRRGPVTVVVTLAHTRSRPLRPNLAR